MATTKHKNIFRLCDERAQHNQNEANDIMTEYLLTKPRLNEQYETQLTNIQKEELQRGLECLNDKHFEPLIKMLDDFIPDGYMDDEMELDLNKIEPKLQIKMYNLMLSSIRHQMRKNTNHSNNRNTIDRHHNKNKNNKRKRNDHFESLLPNISNDKNDNFDALSPPKRKRQKTSHRMDPIQKLMNEQMQTVNKVTEYLQFRQKQQNEEKNKLKSANDTINDLQQEIYDLKQDNNELTDQYEECMEKMGECKESMNELNSTLNDYRDRMRVIIDENKELETRINEYNQDYEQMSKNCDYWKDIYNKCKSELSLAKKQISDWRKRCKLYDGTSDEYHTLTLKQINKLALELQHGIRMTEIARERLFDSKLNCISCMDRPKDIGFVDGCGHIVLCMECENKMTNKKCPICQCPYSRIKKVNI